MVMYCVGGKYDIHRFGVLEYNIGNKFSIKKYSNKCELVHLLYSRYICLV